MRFWDASALVPLLVEESSSKQVHGALATDGEIMTWWGTVAECLSAVARGEREGRLMIGELNNAIRILDTLRGGWIEIEPSTRLREAAVRLLRVHALRAGDALQLAAALSAAEDRPSDLPFLTLDERLAHAADREGFPVVRLDRAGP